MFDTKLLEKITCMELGPMTVEKIDNTSPLLKAMEYFNQLLLQDQEEGHLSPETNEAINNAMVDLAHAIVKFSCSPQVLVTKND